MFSENVPPLVDNLETFISNFRDKPWLEKHQSFLVGERPVLRGYGYSWFSVTVCINIDNRRVFIRHL